MIIKPIRKGLAHGWYSDEQTYNIYFKDADNEISYQENIEETFEYLNVSRYNTALFPMNALSEFLSSAQKERQEQDVNGYTHELYIPFIHIEHAHYIELFSNYFAGYVFDIHHEVHKNYALKIVTEKGLYDLLNVANLLLLFLALTGKEYVDVSGKLIEKYLSQMKALDAPYFIRYLFVQKALFSKKLFQQYHGELEQSDRYEIQFAFGNTAYQRRSFVEGLLPFSKSIIDIGCGEGYYAVPFSRKIGDNDYYAIDIDKEVLGTLQVKLDKNDCENVYPYASLASFLEVYNGEVVDVIVSEVIEHMPKEKAASLIQSILKSIQFDSLIITTPNHDFNQFYVLDDYRHHDHDWEMGSEEFQAWMNTILQNYGVDLEFLAIGDKVNGISTTQGVLVKARGEKT